MASISQNISVAVQVAKIKRNLQRVAKAVEKPVADTLFTQAALIATEMRSFAPVDPDSETPGALKDSVRVEEGRPTDKKFVVVRIKAGGKKTTREGANGKPYDYARAVEFGTQEHPAQPFFFPVYRARRKEARAAVKRAITKAVKEAAKNG